MKKYIEECGNCVEEIEKIGNGVYKVGNGFYQIGKADIAGQKIATNVINSKKVSDVVKAFNIYQNVEKKTVLTYNGIKGVGVIANAGMKAAKTAKFAAG